MLSENGRYDIMTYTDDRMTEYGQPMMKRFGVGDHFPPGTRQALESLPGLTEVIRVGDCHVCYTGVRPGP